MIWVIFPELNHCNVLRCNQFVKGCSFLCANMKIEMQGSLIPPTPSSGRDFEHLTYHLIFPHLYMFEMCAWAESIVFGNQYHVIINASFTVKYLHVYTYRHNEDQQGRRIVFKLLLNVHIKLLVDLEWVKTFFFYLKGFVLENALMKI